MASNEMPEAGQKAPAFSGITGDGSTLSLQDFSGQWLLLYFYPRDNTPGCTKQACNLRDNMHQLEEAGVRVVGVSDDDEASHQKFSSQYDLPFPLIADTDKKVMKSYGAYGEKNFYGKIGIGTKRTSFLIDPEGTVRHVFKRPTTGQHAEEVLAKLNDLS